MDGSSSISSLGLLIRARPMASICCSPPDRVPATCLQRSFRRGKLLIDLLDGVSDLALGAGIGAHLQILLHGQLEEDPASFRAERHALADDLVGGGAQQGGTLEFDGAGARLQQTADGVQGGGFAGAVRADQGDDLTLVYTSKEMPLMAWMLP